MALEGTAVVTASSTPAAVEAHVGRKYRVGRKIGSGSFGEIYLGTSLTTGKEVAIKMESRKKKNPHLLFESRVYKILNDSTGVPEVYWYGVEGDYSVMVMELLGPSLEDLFCYCGRKFRLKTVLMLADQMLQRIEMVHTQGFLHRDIKPHNFLIGRHSKQSTVYVIDFGLAKRYRHPTSHVHIPYREGKSLTGTARYVSINTHMGLEQSRRDDLESLGYVFLYFVRGSLPWQGLKATSKRDKYEKIRDKKVTTSVQHLCRYLASEFSTYISYCRSLKFTERPDYSYLRRLLKDLLFKEGFYYDFVFDWSYLFSSNKTVDPSSSSSLRHGEPAGTPLPPGAVRVQRSGGLRQGGARKYSEDDRLCLDEPQPRRDNDDDGMHRRVHTTDRDYGPPRDACKAATHQLPEEHVPCDQARKGSEAKTPFPLRTGNSVVGQRGRSQHVPSAPNHRAPPGGAPCTDSTTSPSVPSSAQRRLVAGVRHHRPHRPIATSPATVKTTTSQPRTVHPTRTRPAAISLLFSPPTTTSYPTNTANATAVPSAGSEHPAPPPPPPLQGEDNGITIY